MRLVNLHDRQDGLCHWCAGPTLITAPPAHPMRATRDHVVARSKRGGGAANIVLACQACNLARASKPGPPEPLRRHGIVQKLLARCAAQQREFDKAQRRKQIQ